MGNHAIIYNHKQGVMHAGLGGRGQGNVIGQDGASLSLLGQNGTFYNRGVVTGRVVGSDYAQTIVMQNGVIEGLVTLGQDDDTVIWSGGQFKNIVDAGAGSNKLKIEGNVATSHIFQATGGSWQADIAAGQSLSVHHTINHVQQMTIKQDAYLRVYHDTQIDHMNNGGRIWIENGKRLTLDSYQSQNGVIYIDVANKQGHMVTGLLSISSGALDLSQDKIIFAVDNVADLIEDEHVVFAQANHGVMFNPASVGYGFNKTNRTRYDVGGVAGQNATADYHAHQWHIAASFGQILTPWRDLIVTPRVTSRYSLLQTDDFSEQGAGGLNLNVTTDNAQAWTIGMQTDIAYPVRTRHGTFTPSVHGGYQYDVIGDAIQTSSFFAGGGAAFDTQGMTPDPHTFNAGAGLRMTTHQGLDISVQYDAQWRDGYRQHAGLAKLNIAF